MGDKCFFPLNSTPSKKSIQNFDQSSSSDEELIKRDQKQSTQKTCGAWKLGITLASSLLLSVSIWRTNLVTNAVSSQLILKNGSLVFEYWMVEPVTTTVSVYLFNYTNTERFELGEDTKLILEEIGPYSFTVTNTKENVIFHGNGTVSYQERKHFKFAPDLSNGSLEDLVITPSIPYMGALNHFQESGLFVRLFAGTTISQLQSNPFIKLAVGKLLWGYDDRLFKMASAVLSLQKKDLPFKEFGLFAGANDTQRDTTTIHTGEIDISKKGLISRINGEGSLNVWNNAHCNSLEAFPSSALPPYIDQDTIHLYTKEACRRMPLKYYHITRARGLKTFRYQLPEDVFDNSNSEECFCTNGCLPNGVLNVSACTFGVPILTSKPHFLHGDSLLRTQFEGLYPDEEQHGTFLDIEPNLGLILDAKTAVQINVMLRKLPGLGINPKYSNLILPVTWVSMKMDDMPLPLLWKVRGIVIGYIITEAFIYYGPLIISFICVLLLLYKQCQLERQKTGRQSFSTSAESSVLVDSVA